MVSLGRTMLVLSWSYPVDEDNLVRDQVNLVMDQVDLILDQVT